jgi:dihydroorotate dehydrogenase (fumarate)
MHLTTRYMGLTLANPFVASASPLSGDIDTVKRLEDNGAAAVVLFSLFEEHLAGEPAAVAAATSPAVDEAFLLSSPARRLRPTDPAQYLELIRRASAAVDIPIVASLNAVTPRGCADVARDMQQAGAGAIELSLSHIPTDMTCTGAEVEQQALDVLAAVKGAVTIPVAVKVGPFFSAFANMARRFDEAGADALVLFNRFYQPDFDIENRLVVPSLHLSRVDEIRLPLLWISLLHGRLRASLAATTGVHSPIEAIKYLLAGADVVMSASALLHQGPPFLSRLVADVTGWMRRRGYASIDDLRGSMSQHASADPDAFVRDNFIKVLGGYKAIDA